MLDFDSYSKNEKEVNKLKMDYGQEYKRLSEFQPNMESEFWSPESGQHKLTSLGEIEDSEPFEDDNEKKPRKKLLIEVGGKKLTWTFALGKSLASTYGQLTQLGKNKGTLKGVNFIVVVVGEGQNKRFTIVA